LWRQLLVSSHSNTGVIHRAIENFVEVARRSGPAMIVVRIQRRHRRVIGPWNSTALEAQRI
jgi:hypothetical protein